jgi:NTP pyrophosphatase (non-canonical NTP hydrolase)
LTLDDYAAWAAKIAPARLGTADSTEERRALYLVLGLAGEAGEMADHLKRMLRDEAWDRHRLAAELGDIAFYWVRLCALAGCAPSEVLNRSVKNIEARTAKQAASRSS